MLIDIAMKGARAQRDGAFYSEGGGYPVSSAEEKAWCAGWEISCADQIRTGHEVPSAMPELSLLSLPIDMEERVADLY